MGFWDVILPLATINLVTYPSAEGGTTGWTASGGSIAQSAAQQKFGVYSLAVTPTSGSTDGAYYATVSLINATQYTASVWIKGIAGVSYKIWFANTSGTLKGTATTFTATGSWERQEVTWTADSSTTFRIYVTKASGTSTGVFYLDGLQVEAQSAASTYCDGDQEGCMWDGTAHASTSRRLANTRAGGQIVNLDTYGVYVIESDGIGMPPLSHLVQDYALLPGSYLQDIKILPRILDLMNDTVGTSRSDLHLKRKSLINALRPDAIPLKEPVKFVYSGAGSDVEVNGVYDNGLGFSGPNGFTERILARFIGYDPFMYEPGNAAAVLDVNDSATYRYVAAKLGSTGAWSNLGLSANPTTNGTIYAIAVNPLNPDEVFYGGNFTGFNAQSGWSYLVKYTPSTNTWSRVDGASDFNGIVYALAFGADGTLYAGGAFTNAGGDGSADYLCKVVSNNISAVKSGGTGTVYALAYCPLNNSLYFGGSFTDWASNTDIDYAGVYSISADAYAPVATGLISADDVVNGMAVDSRGYVWMVGAFNNAGEAAALGVASVNPSTYAFDYRQTVDVTGYRVACDLSRGIVYIGTTTTDYLLGKIVNNVYTNLDPGDVIVDPYDFVSAIQVDSQGDVYLGVTTAAYQGLAIWVWSGGVFRMFDTSLGLVPSVGCGAIAFAPDGTMYMGLSVTGSYYNSGVTTVTNSGSASAYPIIKIKQTGGTAYLFSLYNLTTGRGLYFENYNHFQILNGETITIDIGKRTITSNSRGNLLSNLLRNCDLANWTLQPGANIISGFVYNSGATVTATIEWRITHWSADGVAA